MKKLIAALALAASLGACAKDDTGKVALDADKVRIAVMLTCALAPTAAQIAQLYTDNKDVRTTEQATALLCAAALPIVKVPG